MQAWPIDVLREVFMFIPSHAPIIAKVCKRFQIAIDNEEFWALRLRTRFNISPLPNGTCKNYYKVCFQAMLKLKQPLIPSGQTGEGSVRRLQNGFASTMSHRIDDTQVLELDRDVVRLKKGSQEVMRWVLIPSTYFLENIINEYWLVRSPAATYLLNQNNNACSLLAHSCVDVFIRNDLIYSIGETTLNIQSLVTNQLLFIGVIKFNNSSHIYHLDGEIAFVTDQNQLLLVCDTYKVYPMPCFFEPQARLNESQLIVKIGDNSFIFDLISLQLLPLNLGLFSFKSDSKVAFFKNDCLTVYEYPNFKTLGRYSMISNHDILKLDQRFVLLRPTIEPKEGRSQFRILYFNENKEYEFSRRKMTYIGSEAFYLLFARLEDYVLQISCFNALTFEFFTPVRNIQNFQFRSATKILPCMIESQEDYLVVSYSKYMIRVKTVLRSINGEIKITAYQYNY